jgi:outer membrane protein TolC
MSTQDHRTSAHGWQPIAGALVAVLATAGLALADQGAAAAAPPAVQAPSGPTLALSMEEAVAMALETSLGLKSQRLSTNIAAQNIAGARAAFLPQVSSSISRSVRESPAIVFEDGTVAVSSSTGLNGVASLRQAVPWFGGFVSADWRSNRNATSGSNSTFNPRLDSSFSVNFTQPLLRNFRIDSARASLQNAEREGVIVDMQLQQRIIATQVGVRNAYLALVGAIEGRRVSQQNMDLAEQSLRNAQARVKVGQSPQIDIVTAEASVESNRESLILAGARIDTAEDALRAQILDPARPDYWEVRLQPTEKIELAQKDIDVNAAIQHALANRLDLAVMKRDMEITDLNLSVSRNNARPSVDFSVGYSARGDGGTEFRSDGTTRVVGFGSVLGDAFGGTYPSWTTGVTVSYPLGHSAAEAALARANIQKQQQLIELRQLELAIVGDVRQAARDVQNSFQRVLATRAALQASERQLEAEERKFAVGLSDTFQLQQRQRDLAAARISELGAIISYSNALIQFDRVQKIP